MDPLEQTQIVCGIAFKTSTEEEVLNLIQQAVSPSLGNSNEFPFSSAKVVKVTLPDKRKEPPPRFYTPQFSSKFQLSLPASTNLGSRYPTEASRKENLLQNAEARANSLYQQAQAKQARLQKLREEHNKLKEDPECTFKPKTVSRKSFESHEQRLKRMEEWTKRKQDKITQFQQANAHRGLEECTFTPKINPKRSRPVSQPRSHQVPLSEFNEKKAELTKQDFHSILAQLHQQLHNITL